MFILDTDAITHDQNAHPILSVKVRNTPREHLCTTSVANVRDLVQVPHLNTEDWTAAAQ